MSIDPRRMTKKQAYRITRMGRGTEFSTTAYFHRFVPAHISLSDSDLRRYYGDQLPEKFRVTKYDRAFFWKYPDFRPLFLGIHIGDGKAYSFHEVEEAPAKVQDYTALTVKTIKLAPFTANFVYIEQGVQANIQNSTPHEVEYAIQRIVRPQPKPEYPVQKTRTHFRGKTYEFQLHRNTETFRTRVTLDDENFELALQCFDSLGNVLATVYPTKVL